MNHVDVRDLQDGQDLDQVFVVRDSEQRTKKDGAPYLKIILGDRTGSVETVAWNEVPRLSECTVGSLMRVSGTFEVHDKYGARINLTEKGTQVLAREAKEGEYELDRLVAGPRLSVTELEGQLFELLESIQQPHLKLLAETVFYGPKFIDEFRDAPAAKGVHQAYKHGLLEHTVSVTQGVSALATGGMFGPVNRDLAVTGALLHDIGKVEVYTRGEPAVDITQAGRLHGEIPLTYYLVRRVISTIPDFPFDLEDAVLHIVISHHGRLEWGSPVVPCTREAALVHAVDALGCDLGIFDRLEGELPSGERWSVHDRPLGTRAWFGPDEGTPAG